MRTYLSWYRSPYQFSILQIDTSDQFNTSALHEIKIPDTFDSWYVEILYDSFKLFHTYHWRVRQHNGTDTTTWSEVRRGKVFDYLRIIKPVPNASS